ncbi:MAG: hypothetical protein ABEJ44_06355 [Halanaeroarchaeum sp.]
MNRRTGGDERNGHHRPFFPSGSRSILLLVSLLVILSGCSGFGNAPGGHDRLPPGLTGNGVEDLQALMDAHSRRLTDRPYTIENRFVSRATGGKPGVRTHRVIRLGADPSRYLASSRTRTWGSCSPSRANRTVLRWSNGTAIAIKRSMENRSTSLGSRNGVGLFYPEPTRGAFDEGLYVLLARSDLAVRAATGKHAFLLGGRISDRPGAVVSTFDRTRNPPNASIVEASVRLIVTDRGLIRYWRVSWVVIRADGDRYRESWTTEISAIGSTRIHRPAWVDVALANETAPTEVPGPIR